MSLDNVLQELTISKFHAGLVAREYTSQEVVAAYLARIDAFDRNGPTLNSIVSVSGTVLAEAGELDAEFAAAGKFRGPLHGVPVIVKDQLETAGLRTTFGNVRASANIPDNDATAVDLLRKAGALILAKSTMPDFAKSYFSTSSVSGSTKNPYAFDRDAGGSSGGSAVAIAANLGLVALGEDTGGSIRLPASFNNIVGLRPTVGLVSTAGISPSAIGVDTVGPMARRVEDVARLLDVLAQPDPRDGLTALAEGARRSRAGSYLDEVASTGKNVRIALIASLLPEPGPDGDGIRSVIDRAMASLGGAGIEIVVLELAGLWDWVRLTSAGRSDEDTDRFIRSCPGIAAQSLQEIYDAGDIPERGGHSRDRSQAPATPVAELAAVRAQQELREYVAGVLSGGSLDALAYPDVQALPPFRHEVLEGKVDTPSFPTNTRVASALRFPAVSVPAGFTERGIPVGLELVGLPFGEGPLLRAAARVEGVLRARRPPALLGPNEPGGALVP